MDYINHMWCRYFVVALTGDVHSFDAPSLIVILDVVGHVSLMVATGQEPVGGPSVFANFPRTVCARSNC